MKPSLEQIDLKKEQRSFLFFKREDVLFQPYWHYHPELELTLITQGRGTRFVGDSIRPYSAIDLILVSENLPHHWVSMADPEIPHQEAYIFQFKKDLFLDFPECTPIQQLFQKARQGLHFQNPSSAIVEQIKVFGELSPIAQLGSLLDIFQRLIQHNNQNTLATAGFLQRFHTAGAQNKIADTTNYILEHLDQKLTVDHMAKYTHMVPQSFCRWFKKHAGHSFTSFLNQSRVQQACQLLINTDDNIQAIAFDCGFESISHFNRTFKKIKGVSPSNYRKLH
jgi:AraC-like DNA-binding protein